MTRDLSPISSWMLVLLLAIVLAGCSARPYEIETPEEANKAVKPYRAQAVGRGIFEYDPDPRPLSLCYSSQLNTREEVTERAQSLCPNSGKLQFFTEDAFFNGCGLLQPNRVTFICTPGPQPPSPYE